MYSHFLTSLSPKKDGQFFNSLSNSTEIFWASSLILSNFLWLIQWNTQAPMEWVHIDTNKDKALFDY